MSVGLYEFFSIDGVIGASVHQVEKYFSEGSDDLPLSLIINYYVSEWFYEVKYLKYAVHVARIALVPYPSEL
jgi:hypothetical protein